MARPLIHIGMPKCASTWLQRHLFIPRNGYHRCYGPLESHLAFISPRPFQWQPPQNIDLHKAGNRVPVITSEALAGDPLAGGIDREIILQRLHQCLPEARILIVIREQHAMLRSLYQLMVNWGSPEPIESLLDTTLAGNAPRFHPDFLSFDHLIQAYQQRFHRDNVLVLTLEQFQANPADFLSEIHRFCGVDGQAFPLSADYGKRENPARNLSSLALKRLYNRYIARTSLSPFGVRRVSQIQGAGNLFLRPPEWFNQRLERRFRQRVLAALGEDYYARSNARTAELTGLDLKTQGYSVSAAGTRGNHI